MSAAKSSISSIDSLLSTQVQSQWASITSQYSDVLSSLDVTALPSSSGTGAASAASSGLATSIYAGRADVAAFPAIGVFGSLVLALAVYL